MGLYDPLTTTNQTIAAPTGTQRILGTPKIPIPEAIPANSAAMLPRSAIPSTTMVKKVTRRPNSSDQVGKTLAGRRAHAGRHLLNHDQGNRGGNQRPEKQVAELGSGLGIGEDATRVVVHVGGNEPRPQDGEERQKPVFQQSNAGGPAAGHGQGHVGSGPLGHLANCTWEAFPISAGARFYCLPKRVL